MNVTWASRKTEKNDLGCKDAGCRDAGCRAAGCRDAGWRDTDNAVSMRPSASLPVLEWHVAWFCCLQARDLTYASRSHCEGALKKWRVSHGALCRVDFQQIHCSRVWNTAVSTEEMIWWFDPCRSFTNLCFNQNTWSRLENKEMVWFTKDLILI